MKFEFKSLTINGQKLVKLSVGDYILWQSGNVILTLSDGTKEYHQYSDGVVPSEAFANRTDIVAAEFKNTITKLDVGVFQYDSNLTSVTIPDSVTEIGVNAFLRCSGATSLEIGSNVETIGQGAFCDCTNLTSVTIPDSVTSIGKNSFLRCSGLTSLEIGSNVETIGEGAFANCSKLTSITIPDKVTSIGVLVFQNCKSLKSVTIDSKVLNSVGINAFNGAPTSGTLYCYEDWYNGLSTTNKTYLGNLYSKWTKVWL